MSINRITGVKKQESFVPGVDNNNFVRVSEVNTIIDVINDILDGTSSLTEVEVGNGTVAAPSMTFAADSDSGLYRIGANNIGIAANGAKVLDIATTGLGITGTATVSSTTDSTSKDTGSIITEGGVGVEKAIFAGTTINAGTALTVGTDVNLAKEVNHNVTVTTTTTAATVGGSLTVTSGQGATSGNGGALGVLSGAGGLTGASGIVSITSGAGGATSGASGAVNVASGAATVGGSGQVNVTSGNTASGLAGDVILTTGTSTATVTVPVVVIAKGSVRKPTSTNVATGTTATVVGLISGCLNVTGTTGNVTLPTGTLISDAIGSVTAGTHFDFIVNTIDMTAADVATIVIAAGVVTAKQISTGDSATDQLLTVTNSAAVNVGVFRLVNIATNSWSLHRIA